MNLVKNTIVVPSTTPTPNQDSERVALFNEDGSPYSAGGSGKRLIYHAYHNGPQLPLADLIEVNSIVYKIDLNNPEHVKYKDPDVLFFAPGENHASWGTVNEGAIVLDLPQNTLITVSFMAQFNLTSPNMAESATGEMKSTIGAFLFPDSEDGWLSSDFGIYREKVVTISGSTKTISEYNQEYINEADQYITSLQYQFVNTQATNQGLELYAFYTLPVGTSVEPKIPMFEAFIIAESI